MATRLAGADSEVVQACEELNVATHTSSVIAQSLASAQSSALNLAEIQDLVRSMIGITAEIRRLVEEVREGAFHRSFKP